MWSSRKKFKNYSLLFVVGCLSVAMLAQSAQAFLLVSEIHGSIEIVDKQKKISSSLVVGSLIDANLADDLVGQGKLKLICAYDGKEFSAAAPGKIPGACTKALSFDKVYRTDENNDAPALFFPEAGKVNQLSHIYWGSVARGSFIVKLQAQQKDGSYKIIFESDPIWQQSRQKRYITYHYLLPESISNALSNEMQYKLTIFNAKNGRSNEESSKPGGRYQLDKHFKSSPVSSIKNKSTAVAALANAINYLNAGDFYAALSVLELVDNQYNDVHVDYLKANILRRSGQPFNYYSALYVNAIEIAARVKNDVLIAVLACRALQENIFDLDEYWSKELARLKNDNKTSAYCTL